MSNLNPDSSRINSEDTNSNAISSASTNETQQSFDNQNTDIVAMNSPRINSEDANSNAREFSVPTDEAQLDHDDNQDVNSQSQMMYGLDTHPNSSKDDLLGDNSEARSVSLPTDESQKSFKYQNKDNHVILKDTDLETSNRSVSTTNAQMQEETYVCSPQRTSSNANAYISSLPRCIRYICMYQICI